MAQPIKNKKRHDLSTLKLKDPAPSEPPAQPLMPRKRGALSGWPMIIAWVGMFIFALHACTHMVAAGDTWVAMACGRHFVNHGVNTVEPFSANSHKAGPTPEEIKTWPKWAQWITDKVGLETVKRWHPTGWVNQNWLTHVIFYLLVPKSSYADGLKFTSNAMVYWKFAVYILTVICVYYTAVILGANRALSAVFACFALFIGRSFLDVRPQGFSNLLVAVFLLILVLAAYRNILFIWLIVPLTVFWCNIHGGYIYIFIMLVPFVALHLLTSISKKRFITIKLKGVYHTIAAGFVAFIAMVLFNPFHLTNLTHTFEISVSKRAERWRDVHEWHPAFAWDNPVGTAVPFLVMYILAWLLLAAWIIVPILASRSVNQYRKRKIATPDEYQWPKIDLPLMLIAALTIYMAIRSRRFIPIAAIAACPILAMFIDQIVRTISAVQSFRKHNRLIVSSMSSSLQASFAYVGVGAVLFFGIWWGLKFKRIYLDPWPADPNLTSVFMRLTASDAKPFCACKFIKDNNLNGTMFNYRTDGGFIAWGQEPDLNTGQVPLKLFMDGRAQAAYNVPAFNRWTNIMFGGPTVQIALERARAMGQEIESTNDLKLTADECRSIGEWIDGQLKEGFLFGAELGFQRDLDKAIVSEKLRRNFWEVGTPLSEHSTISLEQAGSRWLITDNSDKYSVRKEKNKLNIYRRHDVWLVIMPAAQFGSPFVRGLEYASNWPLVLINNKDKIFVDITTPQGKALYDGIFSGKTIYPDEFCKNLAIAHNLLLFGKGTPTKQQGLDLAIRAYQINPSPAPMIEIRYIAGRIPELKSRVEDFCKEVVGDFVKNKNLYAKQHGYRLRVEAIRLACEYMEQVAPAEGNFYNAQRVNCISESKRLSDRQRW